jgi:hypothetical protein
MNDEEMMSELRRVCSLIDPVPAGVVDDASRALRTRRFDEQLAELLLDSAAELTEVRGDHEQVRLLSFQYGELSLEVHLAYLDDRVTINGLVEGALGAAEMDLGGEHRELPIDSEGMFTTEVSRGATRFRLAAQDGVIVTTQWILV